MKIGLILECATDGPDWQVYSGWVKRILSNDVVVEQSSAVNKKILIREAGTRAARLFAEGCDKVFIIWDLWPSWKSTAPSQLADEIALHQSLVAAGVLNPCVYILCVERMLETLLLVDGGAINAVLQIPKQKQKPSNQNNPYKIADPKAYLDKWFTKAKKGVYLDYSHAARIAEPVDFSRLRAKTKEFPRFENGLQQALCAAPLAWTP